MLVIHTQTDGRPTVTDGERIPVTNAPTKECTESSDTSDLHESSVWGSLVGVGCRGTDIYGVEGAGVHS